MRKVNFPRRTDRRTVENVEVEHTDPSKVYAYRSLHNPNNFFKLQRVEKPGRDGEGRDRYAWVDLDTTSAMTRFKRDGGPFRTMQEALEAAHNNEREVFEFDRIGELCDAIRDGRI